MRGFPAGTICFLSLVAAAATEAASGNKVDEVEVVNEVLPVTLDEPVSVRSPQFVEALSSIVPEVALSQSTLLDLAFTDADGLVMPAGTRIRVECVNTRFEGVPHPNDRLPFELRSGERTLAFFAEQAFAYTGTTPIFVGNHCIGFEVVVGRSAVVQIELRLPSGYTHQIVSWTGTFIGHVVD